LKSTEWYSIEWKEWSSLKGQFFFVGGKTKIVGGKNKPTGTFLTSSKFNGI
jgi:hypothetical protein